MNAGASTDPSGDGSRAKVVFFVDDDDQLRSVTARLLKSRGYEVVLAATAEEAWDIIENHEGELDVLLMDINLPDGWGATLAHRLRAARPELALVYTTGFAENDAVLQSGLGHADFVVTKPFTGDELVAELERAMASGS
jgi:CheY-like chemotaxis protein